MWCKYLSMWKWLRFIKNACQPPVSGTFQLFVVWSNVPSPRKKSAWKTANTTKAPKTPAEISPAENDAENTAEHAAENSAGK